MYIYTRLYKPKIYIIVTIRDTIYILSIIERMT